MKEQAKNRGSHPRFCGNGLSHCSAHYALKFGASSGIKGGRKLCIAWKGQKRKHRNYNKERLVNGRHVVYN